MSEKSVSSASLGPVSVGGDTAGERLQYAARGVALCDALLACSAVAKRLRQSGQMEKMYGANQCWHELWEMLHAPASPPDQSARQTDETKDH